MKILNSASRFARQTLACTALAWTAAAPAGQIQDLVAQFVDINVLSLQADVQFMAEPAAITSDYGCAIAGIGVPGEGDYSFFASGPNWRTTSTVDPAVLPGVTSEAAWNGELFQCIDYTTGVLGIFDSVPSAQAWPSLQNPLFALVEFLDPVSDATAGRILLLDEVRTQASAADLTDVQWTQDPVTRSLVYTDFPGATLDACQYSIRVVAQDADHARPVRIDLRNASGAVVARTTFANWQPPDNAPSSAPAWPRNYVFEVFDPPTGLLVSRMTMTVTDLRTNESPMQQSDFLIPWTQASYIFVNDPSALFSP